MNEKSIKQRLVYDFFYPGILGSILYDVLPITFSVPFFTRLVIVIFFSLDYFHLYFLMDKKFTNSQKDTWSYVCFDFLVAVLVFASFKYVDKNNCIALISVAAIPVCFVIYSFKLKYHRQFYVIYAAIFVLLAIAIIFYENVYDYNLMTLTFTILMTLTYLIYVKVVSKN
ncbi:MAG: hypothetical protein EOO91_06425 [Pedobacter sp.]|nr:MAG: hypothetical protein EOO91_06425 [Pedobacter sp.]